jgi:dTDP-4-dehydrorhamnose reductase
MKLLIVGSSGQLARSLIGLKAATAVGLMAIGRPVIDVRMPDSIARAFDRHEPDLVVNTAAYTAVDQAETEPAAAHAVNAAGAGHVAQACQRRGIPLIHTSTDYVFDGAKPSPYGEDDQTAPLNVYGASKLAGEHLVANLCPHHIILRTAWLVSSYGRNFVTTMLRLAETRPRLDVVDDQHGSPTYAAHLAAAILSITERLASRTAPWGVYHAAGAGEATWCDVAREVFRVSASLNGPSAPVRPIGSADYPTRARRPANSRLNCRKLEQAFGVRLADWRAGIAECVRSLHAPNPDGRAGASAIPSDVNDRGGGDRG